VGVLFVGVLFVGVVISGKGIHDNEPFGLLLDCPVFGGGVCMITMDYLLYSKKITHQFFSSKSYTSPPNTPSSINATHKSNIVKSNHSI
jgi:hypothetical protein